MVNVSLYLSSAVKVGHITCDNASNNSTMMKELAARLNKRERIGRHVRRCNGDTLGSAGSRGHVGQQVLRGQGRRSGYRKRCRACERFPSGYHRIKSFIDLPKYAIAWASAGLSSVAECRVHQKRSLGLHLENDAEVRIAGSYASSLSTHGSPCTARPRGNCGEAEPFSNYQHLYVLPPAKHQIIRDGGLFVDMHRLSLRIGGAPNQDETISFKCTVTATRSLLMLRQRSVPAHHCAGLPFIAFLIHPLPDAVTAPTTGGPRRCGRARATA